MLTLSIASIFGKRDNCVFKNKTSKLQSLSACRRRSLRVVYTQPLSTLTRFESESETEVSELSQSEIFEVSTLAIPHAPKLTMVT